MDKGTTKGIREICMAKSIMLKTTGILLLALGAAGCVRSKVVVTSEPSDAEIVMNGVSLGKTPTEQPFTWYWYYDFTARKEGYVTETRRERFRAPPWLWPGADLVMEMMPFYVHDTKRVHIVLSPAQERPEPAFSGN